MAGLPLDADTACLWRFDETSHGNFTTGADIGPNSFTLTAAGGLTSAPVPTTGPTTAHVARVFNHSSSAPNNGAAGDFSHTDSPGAHVALFQTALAEYTLEVFVRFDNLTNSQSILQYGGNTEISADNDQCFFGLSSAGRLTYRHEIGGGLNQTATQSASTIVAGQWYHVAMVVAPVPVVGQVCTFYIDGVSMSSAQIGSGNYPDGGANSVWRVGGSGGTSYEPLIGAMRSVRLSSVARSGAEIAANAALLVTTVAHVVDASTYALWPLDEPADCVDLAGNCHLSLRATGSTLIGSSLRSDLEGQSKYFAGNTTTDTLFPRSPRFPDPTSARVAAVLRGNHTWEMLLRPQFDNSKRAVWRIQNSSGALANNDFEIHCTVAAGAMTFTVNWESGAGVDRTFTTATLPAADVANVAQGAIYVAITQTVTAGNAVILVYVNAVLLDTSSSIAAFDGTGGDSVNTYIVLGQNSSSTTVWLGWIDEMRLSDVARTQQEIEDMDELLRELFEEPNDGPPIIVITPVP